MELRLYRNDDLTTAISSLVSILSNCTGELKQKTDSQSELTGIPKHL